MKKSRRQFIKKTSLASGLIINPFENIFPISNKKDDRNSIVGHGNYKYKVDKKWGIQDPLKFPVNDCHEMVFDKKSDFYDNNPSKKQYSYL